MCPHHFGWAPCASRARPLPAPPSLSPPSLPPRSGAGGGGRARRGARRMDTLSGGCTRRVPERRGARSAREQCVVGARPRRGLRLPAPTTRPPLPAAGERVGGRGGEPGTRTQRRPRKSRAALEGRVDAAPAEATAARAAGTLRGSLSPRAGRGGDWALLGHHGARFQCLSLRTSLCWRRLLGLVPVLRLPRSITLVRQRDAEAAMTPRPPPETWMLLGAPTLTLPSPRGRAMSDIPIRLQNPSRSLRTLRV